MKKNLFLVIIFIFLAGCFYVYSIYNEDSLKVGAGEADALGCSSCVMNKQGPAYPVQLPDGFRKVNQFIFSLDGEEYTKDQLVSDFFQAVFPRYFWQEDAFLQSGFFNGFPIPYISATGRPGVYAEATYRTGGMPRFEGINRWKSPSRIEVVLNSDVPSKQLSRDVSAFVSDFGTKLSAITGLDLSYSDTGRVEVGGQQIFINLNRSMFLSGQLYKSVRFGTQSPAGQVRLSGELTSSEARQVRLARLQGALRFSPMEHRQVDGFIIPNAKNYITRAECDIWPLHPKNILNALIQECIVRSLGFVESFNLNNRSVISKWNRINIADKVRTSIKTTDLLTENVGVNEYSLAILSMLYCSDINSEMGRYDMLNHFYRSNNCFDFSKVYGAFEEDNSIDVELADRTYDDQLMPKEFEDLILACHQGVEKQLNAGGEVYFSRMEQAAVEQAPYVEDRVYSYKGYVDFRKNTGSLKMKRARFVCELSFSGYSPVGISLWKAQDVTIFYNE